MGMSDSPTPQNGPPAGWYSNQGKQQWWNGTAWTSHVAPTPPPKSADVDKTKANYWAVASLVAGIFAIISIGAGEAGAALILGLLATGVAPYALNKKHHGRGRAQAIIGIILGAVPLILALYATLR